MHHLTVLCLVLVFALSAEAAILCNQDTCSKLTCEGEQTKEACHAKGAAGRYKFVERGGSCGCCHKCVKVLNENESCAETISIWGIHVPAAECAENLVCNFERSNLCQKKT